MSEDEFIPQFPDEVTDFTDPRQALAWALAEWPAFGKQQPMPTNLILTPFQSEHLSKLGIRFHEDLAVLWKVRDPKTGLAVFVDADELAEMEPAEPVKKKSGADSVSEMLERVMDEVAGNVSDLSDEERAAKAAEFAPVFEESMKTLARIKAELEDQ